MYKIGIIHTSIIKIAISFLNKLYSVVGAYSILSFKPCTIAFLLCFAVNLIVLKLKKG
jgi:hypothetical protein